jgi:hypothetical protein
MGERCGLIDDQIGYIYTNVSIKKGTVAIENYKPKWSDIAAEIWIANEDNIRVLYSLSQEKREINLTILVRHEMFYNTNLIYPTTPDNFDFEEKWIGSIVGLSISGHIDI